MPTKFQSSDNIWTNDDVQTWTLNYNGFDFWKFKIDVTIQAVKDDQNVSVKWYEYTILAEDVYSVLKLGGSGEPHTIGTPTGESQGAAVVNPIQLDQDESIEIVRDLILQPRGTLTLSYAGIGRIDTNGLRTDVAYGPFPELIDLSAAGGGVTANLKWRCVVRVAACDATASTVVAFGASTSFSVADEIMEATVSGYLEILNSLDETGRPIRSIDDYRRIFTVSLSNECRRTLTWKNSMDGRRADWSYTDKRIASKFALPVFMYDANVTHSMRSVDRGFVKFYGTIAASFTHTLFDPKADDVYNALRYIIRGRWAAIFKAKQKVKINGQAFDIVNGWVMPVSFAFREAVFGRDAGFEVGYLLTTNLAFFMQASGFFAPSTKTTDVALAWKEWSDSLARRKTFVGIQDMRGKRLAARQLCQTTMIMEDPLVPDLDTFDGRTVTPITEQTVPTIDLKTSQADGSNYPPAESSYVHYSHDITVEQDARSYQHPIMQGDRTPPSGGSSGGLPDEGTGKEYKPPDWPNSTPNGFDCTERESKFVPDAGKPHVLQHGGDNPSIRIVFSGQGARAGYPLAVPRIETHGNAKAVEGRSVIRQQIVGVFGAVPLYMAKWEIEYFLDRSPGTAILPPANLAAGIGSQQSEYESGVADSAASDAAAVWSV